MSQQPKRITLTKSSNISSPNDKVYPPAYSRICFWLSIVTAFSSCLPPVSSAKSVCMAAETPLLKSQWQSHDKSISNTSTVNLGGTVFETTVDAGLRVANDHKKFLFVFMRKVGCPHCAAFEQEVLPQASVKEFLNKNFVCALISKGSHDEQILKHDFGCNAFPHFLIFTCNGRLVRRWFGQPHSAKAFIWMAQGASQHAS